MKTLLMTSFVFISTLFNADCSAMQNSLEQEGEIQVLLTFPRSGTNLTLGVLQLLTHKPVESYNPGFEVNRLNLDLDQSKVPLWRAHSYSHIKHLDPNSNKLLMILRNYKECIVTHEKKMGKEGFAAQELRSSVLKNSGGFRGYIDNLRFFDQWSNNNTKLMIYYEDLIKQPEIEFAKMVAFLNEEVDDLDAFFENYDYWKDKILGSYQNQHGAQHSSGGDKEIFHSKEFPVDLLEEIDLHIQKVYPGLWQRYLDRYETQVTP